MKLVLLNNILEQNYNIFFSVSEKSISHNLHLRTKVVGKNRQRVYLEGGV